MAARLIAAATASGVLCACLATIVVASGGPAGGLRARRAGRRGARDRRRRASRSRRGPRRARPDRPRHPEPGVGRAGHDRRQQPGAADDGDARGADGRPHRPEPGRRAARGPALQQGLRHLPRGGALGGRPDVRRGGARSAHVRRAVDARRRPRVGRLRRRRRPHRPAGPRRRRQPAAGAGYHVRGPVALGSDELVLCGSRTRASGPGVLFRWRSGRTWSASGAPGCTPAISRTGVLAWSEPVATEDGGADRLGDRRRPRAAGRSPARTLPGRQRGVAGVDGRQPPADRGRASRPPARARSPSTVTGTASCWAPCAAARCAAHPSPAGDRVILVRTIRGGLAQVHGVDPETGQHGVVRGGERRRRRLVVAVRAAACCSPTTARGGSSSRPPASCACSSGASAARRRGAAPSRCAPRDRRAARSASPPRAACLALAGVRRRARAAGRAHGEPGVAPGPGRASRRPRPIPRSRSRRAARPTPRRWRPPRTPPSRSRRRREERRATASSTRRASSSPTRSPAATCARSRRTGAAWSTRSSASPTPAPPGWAPDGRLALVGPLGRPPGSVSSLWLLARNGGTEVIDVPDRSVNGRPAFWDDRTVDMCTVTAARPAAHDLPARVRPARRAARAGLLPVGGPRRPPRLRRAG